MPRRCGCTQGHFNRLAGDASQPPEKRVSHIPHNPFKPDSKLQPAGLLGPVRLLATE